METKAEIRVRKIQERIERLQKAKRNADEAAARHLMRANDIEEKINAALVALRKARGLPDAVPPVEE